MRVRPEWHARSRPICEKIHFQLASLVCRSKIMGGRQYRLGPIQAGAHTGWGPHRLGPIQARSWGYSNRTRVHIKPPVCACAHSKATPLVSLKSLPQTNLARARPFAHTAVRCVAYFPRGFPDPPARNTLRAERTILYRPLLNVKN